MSDQAQNAMLREKMQDEFQIALEPGLTEPNPMDVEDRSEVTPEMWNRFREDLGPLTSGLDMNRVSGLLPGSSKAELDKPQDSVWIA